MFEHLTPSIDRPAGNTFRVKRGDVIVGFVVHDGEGWKVRPNGVGRGQSRKSWLTPRKAFEAYYRAETWAKSLIADLPDEAMPRGV